MTKKPRVKKSKLKNGAGNVLASITRITSVLKLPDPTTPTCSCGAQGTYTGTQPMGGHIVRIAFRCQCGNVWGFNIQKTELGKYRPEDPS
jgi:hypothetical protein